MGNASFDNCSLSAISVYGGSLELCNRSLVNRSYYAIRVFKAGTVRYVRPAPLGRWVFIPDGGTVATLPHGIYENAYPYPCAAGVVGDDYARQTSPACARWCDAGFYCPTATVHPKPCSAGTFCVAASPAPVDCPAGTVGRNESLRSVSECERCLPGEACPRGSNEPSPCRAGYFASGSGSAYCTPCAPGTFSSTQGATACTDCAPGSWCSVSAQVPCGQNKWSNQSNSFDQADCILCPPDSSTQGALDAASPDVCVCNQGFFKSGFHHSGGPACTPCGVGTRCLEAGTTRFNITLQVGYWRPSNESLDVRRCSDSGSNCSATGQAICDSSSSGCRGGNDTNAYCGPGLTGPLCELCAETTDVFYEKATTKHVARCSQCGNQVVRAAAIVAGLAAGVVALVVLARVFAKKAGNAAVVIGRFWHTAKPETKMKVRASGSQPQVRQSAG
jgi:hypothetical protein